MTVSMISIYYMLLQFRNMTSLPYLFIPCVSTANPQLSLDYPQDSYRPIFNCKGTTLTLITRDVPAPAMSTKFLELSFVTSLESYLQAKEFVMLTYADSDVGQNITADIPSDLMIQIKRTEMQSTDRQFLIEFQPGYSIVWTHSNDETRIIIRYLPQHGILYEIYDRWLWKFEFLLRTHKVINARNMSLLKTTSDEW
jgi:hypothetical protein